MQTVHEAEVRDKVPRDTARPQSQDCSSNGGWRSWLRLGRMGGGGGGGAMPEPIPKPFVNFVCLSFHI